MNELQNIVNNQEPEPEQVMVTAKGLTKLATLLAFN